jgi:hypothetical protein
MLRNFHARFTAPDSHLRRFFFGGSHLSRHVPSCVESASRLVLVALLAAPPYTHNTMEDAATVICVLLVLVGVGSGLYILNRAAEVEKHDAAMSRKIEELEARNTTHHVRRNSPHADFLRAMIPDEAALQRINERMLRRPSQDDLKLLS